MAKIYKIEGYIVDPNGNEVDVEHLVERYTDGIPFMYKEHCSCEEFEWDDDVIPNHTDDYWEIDKFYCQLAYDRTVEELRKHKKTWRKIEGIVTPGGDPAFECPKCGKGKHIFSVFSVEPHKRCRDCGAELIYPWEVE